MLSARLAASGECVNRNSPEDRQKTRPATSIVADGLTVISPREQLINPKRPILRRIGARRRIEIDELTDETDVTVAEQEVHPAGMHARAAFGIGR